MAHTPVIGYRDLSPEEVVLMNECKSMAIKVGELVEAIKSHPETDQRWAAIGRTHLQEGFMSLIRSIAKPTTF